MGYCVLFIVKTSCLIIIYGNYYIYISGKGFIYVLII